MLPEALYRAYLLLGEEEYLQVAESSLNFLIEKTETGGFFNFVGNQEWLQPNGDSKLAQYDQQPIEAGLMVEASLAGYDATGEMRHLHCAWKSLQWFFGRNAQGLSLHDLETGEPLPEPPDLKFFDFGSPCNTIDGWYCTYDPIRCVTAEGKPAVQMNYEPARAMAEQMLPRKDFIPFLWDGRPDANLLGGTVYDPMQFNVTVNAGYRSLLGTVIGKAINLGAITPHIMFPFNYDWRTGEPIPGQNIDPSLVVPGISEGGAYVSTTGRYIVQKAELSTLVYYYLLQNHIFPFPIPGLPEVYIPDDYRVGQPVGGFAIYEPESYRDGARNQAELGVFHVEWARDNLCESGCGLEEAAARLGSAAWNLDHAFNKQLKEALDRGEIQSGLYKKVLD